MLLRAVALLLLVACSTTPPAANMDAIARALEQAHAPAAVAVTGVPAPEALTARLRLFWGLKASSCAATGGVNPVIVLFDQAGGPKVGVPIRFAVLSSWLEPRPDTTFFLIVGTRPLTPPFDLGGSGARGCQLLVQWDSLTVMGPGVDSVGVWHRVGPGRVDFEWTPLPGHANTRWYVQAGIAAPGENQLGLLTTSAVEIWVAADPHSTSPASTSPSM